MRLVIVVLVVVLYWLRICLYNAHFRASLADLRRSKRSNFLVHSGMLMLVVLCRLITCEGQVRVLAVLREDVRKNLHRDYVSQCAHRIQKQHGYSVADLTLGLALEHLEDKETGKGCDWCG